MDAEKQRILDKVKNEQPLSEKEERFYYIEILKLSEEEFQRQKAIAANEDPNLLID